VIITLHNVFGGAPPGAVGLQLYRPPSAARTAPSTVRVVVGGLAAFTGLLD
jgi:hypothetical protein